MNTIIKIIGYSLVFLLLIALVYGLSIAIQMDYDYKIPMERNCNNKKVSIDFKIIIAAADSLDLENSFPYDEYLESGNYCDAAAIESGLNELNRTFPKQQEKNSRILMQALTNKLMHKIAPSFREFNPDSLIIMLHWAEEFKAYEKCHSENTALFGIIYSHWMGFISNQLSTHYESNSDIKFGFKFNYLQSRCQSQRFAPAVGKSNIEKVVQYTLNQEYCYLFNRFWNGTNGLVKMFFVGLFCFFLYLFYCTYQYNFKNQ